jgi:hypothetical protein
MEELGLTLKTSKEDQLYSNLDMIEVICKAHKIASSTNYLLELFMGNSF